MKNKKRENTRDTHYIMKRYFIKVKWLLFTIYNVTCIYREQNIQAYKLQHLTRLNAWLHNLATTFCMRPCRIQQTSTRLTTSTRSNTHMLNIIFSTKLWITYSNTCFNKPQTEHTQNFLISWNFRKYSLTVVNLDESFSDTPIHTSFGCILCTSNGTWKCGFFGFVLNSSDILNAELWAIFKGLSLAKGMTITESTCYSEFSLTISLIENPLNKYHKHAVLIQSIKDITLENTIFIVIHTLREGNQSLDYMATLRTTNDIDLLIHPSPPQGMSKILAAEATRTSFLRI